MGQTRALLCPCGLEEIEFLSGWVLVTCWRGRSPALRRAILLWLALRVGRENKGSLDTAVLLQTNSLNGIYSNISGKFG